jgi:ankyrin repeat protein
MWYD